MHPINQRPFERLTRLLDPLDPAELHGLLCGLLCADADLDPERWLFHARNHLPDDVELAESVRDLLLKLFEYGAAQLDALDWSATPLLPDDDAPLSQRADALGIWCQGLLYGLGLGEVERRGDTHVPQRRVHREVQVADVLPHHLDDQIAHLDAAALHTRRGDGHRLSFAVHGRAARRT